MPFLCPKCSTPQSLEIKAKIKLPPKRENESLANRVRVIYGAIQNEGGSNLR